MKKLIFILLPLYIFAANINWVEDFDSALNIAKKRNLPIMVYYESYHCKWCKKMLNTTLKNSKVVKIVNKNFVPVKVFKEENNYPSFIYSKYTPTTFFITADGKNIIRPVMGYWDIESFLSFIDDVKRKMK